MLLISVLLASTALAQPKFEVASIKPVVPHSNQGITVTGGRVSIGRWTIRQLVLKAYGLEVYQVAGPDAIDTQRFDISAKLPAGAAETEIPAMIPALLAERFGMQIHTENKQVSAYELVVSKEGHKLKPAEDDGSTYSLDVLDDLMGDGQASGAKLEVVGGNLRLTFTKLPTLGIAQVLSSYLREPIFDHTDLKGRFQGSFEFSMPVPPNTPARANEITVPESVRPLGLRLERTKGPVTMFLVDKVNATPTEN